MTSTWLSEQLEMCYDPTVAIHTLSGKAVSRVIRDYFVVEAVHTTKTLSILLPQKSQTQ